MTAARPCDPRDSGRAPATLRMMVFNTQHASPARALRQAAWIAGHDHADVVVLTEVGTGPGGDALLRAMADHGYTTVLGPPLPRTDYRAALVSRGPRLTPLASGIETLPHRGPAAVVELDDHTVGLMGLYVPSRGPRERRNQDKRAFQQAVTNAVPRFLASLTGPAVIAGDFNVIEPGHVPHLPVFGAWEYSFYRSFATAGLADAYRLTQPRGRQHSWFGRSGNGYRIDHIFVTRTHTAHVRACGYDDQPRQHGLTDHAAMTLTLALGQPHGTCL
jgi:exodeoxyribonuclease III